MIRTLLCVSSEVGQCDKFVILTLYPGGVERHGAFLSRERDPDVALNELPPVEVRQSGARLLEGGGPSLSVDHTLQVNDFQMCKRHYEYRMISCDCLLYVYICTLCNCTVRLHDCTVQKCTVTRLQATHRDMDSFVLCTEMLDIGFNAKW